MSAPLPFEIAIAPERVDDMRRRIEGASWPGDFGNDDWRYGVNQDWLSDMARYWARDFDWEAQQAKMNRLPQFIADIDGISIHFVHLKSGRPDAIPLILTHGWPWTFWDWHALIEPLVTGERDGPAFDVVVPSLPGVCFSAPLATTGIGLRRIGQLWVKLMAMLGYDRFAAAGGDWGAGVTAELGHAHAEHIIAAHVSLMMLPGLNPATIGPDAFAEDEQWMLARAFEALPTITSHVAVQSADPQTLAYALADSPIGTAAWLWERRRNWSDCDGDVLNAYSRDFLCTTASLYWLTNTIGSSMRIYAEQFKGFGLEIDWPVLNDAAKTIPVPFGVAIAPREVAFLPRAIVAEKTDLRRWQRVPAGGHFLPAEQPGIVLEEYRAFFSSLS
ncbi:epoxide hydrolase family protein [Croceicoccus mobilis]|uniref:epoxide hydrolase family protein n=1 Tax=Croceicoccus mobilis TaxID=1703339 RepID=UPI00082D23F3|nr:epoxide hydrolase family protein [Croceicoccus mobilis]